MTSWSRIGGLVALVLLGCATGDTGSRGLEAADLRCESRVEPLGIDETAPRLSWRLEETGAAVRGRAQTAYRVLVASSPDALARDQGDLWDSGRVESNATYGVEYAGAPLRSGTDCWWKVMAWDERGEPTPWSEPARFSLGLLAEQDWRADWIGFDAPRRAMEPTASLIGARWIWFAGDAPQDAPGASRAFRGEWELPEGTDLASARLMITADNFLDVWINGQPVAIPAEERTSFERGSVLVVGQWLQPGRNVIAVEAGNESQGPAGLIAKLVAWQSGGRRLERITNASWRSSDTPGEGWTGPGFDDAAWPAARELGSHGAAPWGEIRAGGLFLPPPRYLRREFEAADGLRRATVYASALGIYELRLNGERVADDYFTPGWTDYPDRVYYQTYDVTDRVRSGGNALAAVLADGWYSGHIGWGQRRDHYGTDLRFRAKLVLEYESGLTQVVATDGDWKAATGPLLEADFLMGETYDARREMPGWDAAGFDDGAWIGVDVTPAIDAPVQAHPGPLVGELETFEPVELTEPTPGVYVLDLGQNFAGVPRLRVRGKPNQEIVLRFAERLNPDGTIYTTNLRGARAIDRYVCRGGGEEVWQPRFTFHGFQYVEVTGLDAPPAKGDVVGVALGSRTPQVGTLEVDDPMLTQLLNNIYWTQRANYIEVPTDCPQRDERLGWTGDAQVYVRTATYLCDVQSFYAKWLVDLADGQREDGQFPTVAPLIVSGGDGGPAWADAGTICPWTIYEVYGDRRLLARHYEGMKRYVAFTESRCTPELRPPAQFHCFGDWLNIDDNTPTPVIYMAYFARSTDLTARAARVVGTPEEVRRYEELLGRIKASFRDAFVDEQGRIEGDTQTAYVLAIAFDLVDGELRDAAASHLLRKLEERDWHLSTGFVGTKDLMGALSQIGRTDVAYRLLHNETFPSWGFSIAHGATSIWERWNGWTPEGGFNDPGMNSFAHYSFGAVGEWMFKNLGGIDLLAPGYDEILVRPRPDPSLDRARASYGSVHGPIETSWRREGAGLRLDVTIPPNTTAVVHVPCAEGQTVTEGGGPLEASVGVEELGREDGALKLRVPAGRYAFDVE